MSSKTGEVVEMDAIDLAEWDRDRHTPQAHDANLAALVKQTADKSQPVARTASNHDVDGEWETVVQKPASETPSLARTKTTPNTVRRTQALGIPALTPRDPAKPAKQRPPTGPAGAPIARASTKPVVTIPSTKPAKPAASTPPARVANAKPPPAQQPKRPPTAERVASERVAPEREQRAAAPVAAEPPQRPSEPAVLPPPPIVAAPPAPPPIVAAPPAPPIVPSPIVAAPPIAAAPAPFVAAPPIAAPLASAPPAPIVVAPPPAPTPMTLPTVAARETPVPLGANDSSSLRHEEPSSPQLDIEPAPLSMRGRAAGVLATVLPTPKSRRTAAIVAAVALVLVVIIVMLSRGSDSKPAAVATAEPTKPSVQPEPRHAAVAAPAPSPTETAAPAKPAPTPTRLAPPAKQPIAKPPIAKQPIVRRVATRKPIVVDYDKKPVSPPASDEALSRARVAYGAGNQQLFAGQTDAAIAHYQASLREYPNYAAGYRGLGLAYAQKGNTAEANKAFKTYLKLAPLAKDAAMIKKRIVQSTRR